MSPSAGSLQKKISIKANLYWVIFVYPYKFFIMYFVCIVCVKPILETESKHKSHTVLKADASKLE